MMGRTAWLTASWQIQPLSGDLEIIPLHWPKTCDSPEQNKTKQNKNNINKYLHNIRISKRIMNGKKEWK